MLWHLWRKNTVSNHRLHTWYASLCFGGEGCLVYSLPMSSVLIYIPAATNNTEKLTYSLVFAGVALICCSSKWVEKTQWSTFLWMCSVFFFHNFKGLHYNGAVVLYPEVGGDSVTNTPTPRYKAKTCSVKQCFPSFF